MEQNTKRGLAGCGLLIVISGIALIGIGVLGAAGAGIAWYNGAFGSDDQVAVTEPAPPTTTVTTTEGDGQLDGEQTTTTTTVTTTEPESSSILPAWATDWWNNTGSDPQPPEVTEPAPEPPVVAQPAPEPAPAPQVAPQSSWWPFGGDNDVTTAPPQVAAAPTPPPPSPAYGVVPGGTAFPAPGKDGSEHATYPITIPVPHSKRGDEGELIWVQGVHNDESRGALVDNNGNLLNPDDLAAAVGTKRAWVVVTGHPGVHATCKVIHADACTPA